MASLRVRRPSTPPDEADPFRVDLLPGFGRGEDPAAPPPVSPPCTGLTLRETEVALWLSRGKTNYEIGRILSISVRTVEKHVEHVLQKLAVENRTTAALLMAEWFRALTRI